MLHGGVREVPPRRRHRDVLQCTLSGCQVRRLPDQRVRLHRDRHERDIDVFELSSEPPRANRPTGKLQHAASIGLSESITVEGAIVGLAIELQTAESDLRDARGESAHHSLVAVPQR